MSGECEKCHEHTLDCWCFDESVITASAAILAKNINEIQIRLALEVLAKENLLEEFAEFYAKNECHDVFSVIKEFGKLYPDKFIIPDQNECYENFVII